MKKILFLMLLLCFSASSAYPISADLSDVGVGARPLGLGKAYTGYAEDTSAIFLNPAGLATTSNFGLVSMTGRLLEDVTYVSVGISNPFPFGALGFGYINASTGGIPLTTLTRTTTEVTINQYGVTDYSSSILFFSYAKDVLPNLFGGANLKVYTQGFSQTTGSLEGGTGTGMDIDLGVKWKPRTGISLGMDLQNILPASMGGKFTWKKGYSESIPALFKLGTSFKILGADALTRYNNQDLIWNTDVEMSMQASHPSVWKTGLEWWINPILALRTGIDQKIKAAETGVGIDNNLALGIGFKYRGMSFDYAYHQYGELTENATHFFSFGYAGETEPNHFGDKVKQKIKGIVTLKIEAVKNLKHFNDVPSDYWAKDAIEYLATLSMMTGYPDDTFRPAQPLTRAELAALLVKAKGFEVKEPDHDLFSDLPASHWASPYIEVALKRKYMYGYPDQKFRPWKEVTRAEAIIVLIKFAGLTEPASISSKPFPDIQKNHWAARSIAVAKQNGMLEYLSGSNFEPDKPFSRAEAAEVISKTGFAKEKIQELLKK